MLFAFPHPAESFWTQSKDAKRLMVLDLGFLGDTVHLIPALWAIRQAWPKAELHVMVAEHIKSLMQVTPWVDKVWGYPRFPKGPKPWQDFGRVKALRKAKFDAVINLNGSDRSSWLTFLSGARWRLGRRPLDGGGWGWGRLFTHVVEVPFKTEPLYVQRWRCVRATGVPVGPASVFKVDIATEGRRRVGITEADDGHYIHISPFTTADRRELPLMQLAEVMMAIQSGRTNIPIVISCAPNERERVKLAELLKLITFTPWKVFAGDLNLTDLVSVLGGARLHIGGDSGGIHLAVMANISTVSWFRMSPGLTEWQPEGLNHRVLTSDTESEMALHGIRTNEIIESVEFLLGGF
jgi:heptosyltransferase-3